MKFKLILISSILYFIAVNTSYFWSRNLGFIALLTFLIGIFIFVIFSMILVVQSYRTIKEKFTNKKRIILIFVLLVILLLSYYRPNGLIDFESLSGNDLLIAEREGSANCASVLKLKDNDKFIERIICFGSFEYSGEYYIKNDTIFFYNVKIPPSRDEYYDYAIIQPANTKSFDILRYKSENDSTGNWLRITKNDLILME